MAGFAHPWALGGGWACDAWLGRETRSHGDLDVVVFEHSQRAVFDYLEGWHFIAHDAFAAAQASTEPWHGRRLRLPAHVHARADSRERLLEWVPSGRGSNDGRDVEIILNAANAGAWVLSEDPATSLLFAQAILTSPWGLPTTAPEVLLFYKATAYFGVAGMKERPHDEADFSGLLPLLSPPGREWLGEAVAALHPAHPWLPRVGG